MVMDKLNSIWIWFNDVNNHTEFINFPVDLAADVAIRRLMFASMLMYKIDEAVKYSKIQEQ